MRCSAVLFLEQFNAWRAFALWRQSHASSDRDAYGSTLLANPAFIGTSFGLGDVSTNTPLLSVAMLYGKLFITVGLLSSLTIYMLQKEMPLAVVATLIMAINMLVTGVLGYGMSGKPVYLYADLCRGVVVLVLLFGYVRYVQSKRCAGL